MHFASFRTQMVLWTTLLAAVGAAADGPSDLVTVSAASFRGPVVAAESVASAFGQYLAVGTQAASTVPLPTTLLGTRLKVVDSAGAERFAPLFFVSSNQINYLMPAGVAPGPVAVTVTSGAGHAASGSAQVVAIAPGLFAANSNGRGVAAALAVRERGDGAKIPEPVFQFDAEKQQAAAVPLDLGSEQERVILSLFGTGLRSGGPHSTTTVTIGGEAAEVLFAGAQGAFVGLDQVNVVVPRRVLGRGEVAVLLTVDDKASNPVTISIR